MKMRISVKINILVYWVFSLCANGTAQQTSLFSEYNYAPFRINAAYAGMSEGAEASISSHGFLNSIEGSPRTHTVSFNMPIPLQNLGAGAFVNQDKIGVTSTTTAYAALSYQINFGSSNNRSYMRTPYWRAYNRKVLSFGMTAGFKRVEENLLELGLANDPEFSENLSASSPVIGVGFLYNTADFFIGISSPNLLGNVLVKNPRINFSNPVYGYLGYRFIVGSFTETMVKPNFLLKYEVGAPLQLDSNISISFQDKFELGAGYRSTSSVNIMAGVYALNRLRFIYQHSTGIKKSFLGNSHGATVTYFFSEMD